MTPFQVIQGRQFGTSRMVVCDFLLVSNTNLHLFLHSFQVIAHYWLNACFQQGVSLFNCSLD